MCNLKWKERREPRRPITRRSFPATMDAGVMFAAPPSPTTSGSLFVTRSAGSACGKRGARTRGAIIMVGQRLLARARAATVDGLVRMEGDWREKKDDPRASRVKLKLLRALIHRSRLPSICCVYYPSIYFHARVHDEYTAAAGRVCASMEDIFLTCPR